MGYLVIAFLTLFELCHSIPDWLTTDITMVTQLTKTERGTLRLTNGIIYREFTVTPDFGTVDFYSEEKQSSVLRALSPEAAISIGDRQYNISGLEGKIPRAYLNRTALASAMTMNPNAFHYVTHRTMQPEAPYKYTPKRGAPKDLSWPPKGLRLDVMFKAPSNAPAEHQQVKVVVHYEMYDGVPLMTKWLSVFWGNHWANHEESTLEVSIDVIEHLAVNWQWSEQGYNWMDIQTDQPHNREVIWNMDPTQPEMPGSFEPRVICRYRHPPTLTLDQPLDSFRVHEMLHGSSDPERVGLAKRRRFRLLAPQTQENPIFFHMVESDSLAVRKLIDQMEEVGFEMLIYSFKSGFDFESTNDTYIENLAKDVAYAKSKGIEVGGHDLIVWDKDKEGFPSEWIADTRSQYHGACMASGWYDHLLEQYTSIMKRTGMTMIEADGPYPGYGCYATNHTHHKGYQDSIYKQIKLQGQFFQVLHERGVFINQPDAYFFYGANKAVLGYEEAQFALPRWQDLSVSRQGMFDDTFRFTPTIGWMIVPLIDYKQQAGADGMFEPLSDNIKSYEWALAQYLGAGVAACYRGFRLYDTNETKVVVKKWVDFYKKYREILSSDLIHVRRPDMQSMDSFMHVNHRLSHRALAMVFNPTLGAQTMKLTLPLYYTGLNDKAWVRREEGQSVEFQLDRGYNVEVEVELEPLGITWFLVQESDSFCGDHLVDHTYY